jgi:hypothetical protein
MSADAVCLHRYRRRRVLLDLRARCRPRFWLACWLIGAHDLGTGISCLFRSLVPAPAAVVLRNTAAISRPWLRAVPLSAHDQMADAVSPPVFASAEGGGDCLCLPPLPSSPKQTVTGSAKGGFPTIRYLYCYLLPKTLDLIALWQRLSLSYLLIGYQRLGIGTCPLSAGQGMVEAPERG